MRAHVLVFLVSFGAIAVVRPPPASAQEQEQEIDMERGFFSAGYEQGSAPGVAGLHTPGIGLRIDSIMGMQRSTLPLRVPVIFDLGASLGWNYAGYFTWDLRLGLGTGLVNAAKHRALVAIGGVGSDRWIGDDMSAPAALYAYGGVLLAIMSADYHNGVGGSVTLHARWRDEATQELRVDGWVNLFNLRFGTSYRTFRNDLFDSGDPVAYVWMLWLGAGFASGSAR